MLVDQDTDPLGNGSAVDDEVRRWSGTVSEEMRYSSVSSPYLGVRLICVTAHWETDLGGTAVKI